MKIYNIITAICFGILTLEVLYFALSFALRDRAGRIAFLRSFKKGKCAIIYFSAIPLFCVGHIYAGENFLESFFTAVNQIINLVVLKYSTSSVQKLLMANQFYKITIYYCFILIGINALFFTFSLTSQRVWQFLQLVKAHLTAKDKLFIFGYNRNNLNIYRSDKSFNKVIIDDIKSEDCDYMYASKINYNSCRSPEKVIEHIKMVVQKKKYCTVIINTENEDKNISLCQKFIELIDEMVKEKQDKEGFFKYLRIYVFGDPRYEAIYIDIMLSAYGCISYKNKYQMIAMNFIDKYPFAKFMDERHINYETSLVKEGIDINVCMIGFGKTNRQIFLTSVANNQFLTNVDGNIELKKVNYHIFDKHPAKNNKNLNHSYYRFENECMDSEGDYLPLPSVPASEHFNQLDINDPQFYGKIKNVISNQKAVNFIIIAFGTDLENIDMAQKIVEKRREWGIENTTIFVKVRNRYKGQALLKQEKCCFIGNEYDDVYNLTEITSDNILRMSQIRNEIYDLEYRITHEPNLVVNDKLIEENREDANKKWYLNKHQWERESNLYCCLSLKSKLNLIGLDYCRVDDNDAKPLSEKEFYDIYAKGHLPDVHTSSLTANGKKIVRYNLDFKPSLRTTLALQEHFRWNSFMISKGMIPASKEQIFNEMCERNGKMVYTNGKSYILRRHGNITTFEGLVEFRKMIAKRDNCTEEEADVFKYDYQIMDDAYWLLSNCGYKIIKINKR